MAPRYIFASEIQQALGSGGKELELPKGSRLSPQAADLIREYHIKVTFVDPEAAPAATDAAPAVAEPKVGPHSVLPEPAPAAAAPAATEEQTLDEAQVEAIAQLVLAKLAQAKGQPVLSPAKPAPEPDDDLIICRCEEITKGQIKEAIRAGMSTLNGVKRVTRAGMGLCQGQTCARLVSGILARELGLPPSALDPTTARAPNRPVSMKALARG